MQLDHRWTKHCFETRLAPANWLLKTNLFWKTCLPASVATTYPLTFWETFCLQMNSNAFKSLLKILAYWSKCCGRPSLMRVPLFSSSSVSPLMPLLEWWQLDVLNKAAWFVTWYLPANLPQKNQQPFFTKGFAWKSIANTPTTLLKQTWLQIGSKRAKQFFKKSLSINLLWKTKPLLKNAFACEVAAKEPNVFSKNIFALYVAAKAPNKHF